MTQQEASEFVSALRATFSALEASCSHHCQLCMCPLLSACMSWSSLRICGNVCRPIPSAPELAAAIAEGLVDWQKGHSNLQRLQILSWHCSALEYQL